jgi:hypothetical protein
VDSKERISITLLTSVTFGREPSATKPTAYADGVRSFAAPAHVAGENAKAEHVVGDQILG